MDAAATAVAQADGGMDVRMRCVVVLVSRSAPLAIITSGKTSMGDAHYVPRRRERDPGDGTGQDPRQRPRSTVFTTPAARHNSPWPVLIRFTHQFHWLN